MDRAGFKDRLRRFDGEAVYQINVVFSGAAGAPQDVALAVAVVVAGGGDLPCPAKSVGGSGSQGRCSEILGGGGLPGRWGFNSTLAPLTMTFGVCSDFLALLPKALWYQHSLDSVRSEVLDTRQFHGGSPTEVRNLAGRFA